MGKNTYCHRSEIRAESGATPGPKGGHNDQVHTGWGCERVRHESKAKSEQGSVPSEHYRRLRIGPIQKLVPQDRCALRSHSSRVYPPRCSAEVSESD
jgi:hypothetical protein